MNVEGFTTFNKLMDTWHRWTRACRVHRCVCTHSSHVGTRTHNSSVCADTSS